MWIAYALTWWSKRMVKAEVLQLFHFRTVETPQRRRRKDRGIFLRLGIIETAVFIFILHNSCDKIKPDNHSHPAFILQLL